MAQHPQSWNTMLPRVVALRSVDRRSPRGRIQNLSNTHARRAPRCQNASSPNPFSLASIWPNIGSRPLRAPSFFTASTWIVWPTCWMEHAVPAIIRSWNFTNLPGSEYRE